MDNKQQLVSTAVKQKQELQHHKQQEKLSEQSFIGDLSQPRATPLPSPKVTVSLPKHAASKLRDLVQKRDIALLRLGILSVQFENDQIIPLTLNNTCSTQHKQQQSIVQTNPIIEPSLDSCNADCIDTINTSLTSLSGLTSPNGPMIGEDEDLESTINTSDLPMLDSSIAVATTACAQSLASKTDCNTKNLAVVYDDDDDDDKDEDEVTSEVENQHNSYNIHQLSQLEFADPIELEMYDNDNLLFPDYTLNLS